MRHALFDTPMSIQKLPPERHGLKAITDHARRRDIRGRKQTTIRLEIVQPRHPHHLDPLREGPLYVSEESGQVRTSLPQTGHAEGRVSLRVGILEVDADAVSGQ